MFGYCSLDTTKIYQHAPGLPSHHGFEIPTDRVHIFVAMLVAFSVDAFEREGAQNLGITGKNTCV